MKLKHYIYSVIMPFRRLYWRLLNPKTFGVKILIRHPQNQNEILLIRHSYGNQTLWNIPGGGFNPNKELAKEAAVREVQEEVGVAVMDLQLVGEYKTSSEGKRDTVTLFAGTVSNTNFILNNEIAEFVWQDYRMVLKRTDVARVAIRAIEASFPSKYINPLA